ncbi:hypothetical protein RHGRI_006527 [Rhododendron griersonianum]|uniref:Strictosidine synthase-like protein n=1 Tax=Rhododendron griersonianum TaxID=479676 RepID=A0AAV6KUG9_9ERIC|nr:hypothetical protein RHGRI_006527 [Rhododendron griersonianum]
MEHVCGRPLGLRFDKNTGDLYIADAYFGLQVVGPSGGLATQLVAEVEGHPLLFTNDMDIDEDKDVIYFTDTSTSFHRRILRLWLDGPNAGNFEVFADLPGFVDNIRRNSKGEFWVALHAKKGLLQNWAVSNPLVGKALLKLPLSFKKLHYLLVGGKPHGGRKATCNCNKIHGLGQSNLDMLEDSEGKSMMFTSEVVEENGRYVVAFLDICNLNS